MEWQVSGQSFGGGGLWYAGPAGGGCIGEGRACEELVEGDPQGPDVDAVCAGLNVTSPHKATGDSLNWRECHNLQAVWLLECAL